MWFGFFLVLIAVPLLELALLIKLGQVIGVFGTFAVLFLSAGLGLMVMQAQGWAAFNRASDSLRQGQAPVEPMLDSFMLMLAGGLLIMPGLLSDAVGLLLLIPPVRRAIAGWWLRRSNIEVHTWTQRTEESATPDRQWRRPTGPGNVIEGEFERIDDPKTDPQARRDDRLQPQPPKPRDP